MSLEPRPMASHAARLLLCWPFVGAAGAEEAPSPAPSAGTAEPQLDDVCARLRKTFDGAVERPEAYVRQVEKECGMFPEGDLFPYLMPAFAYTNLAVAEPAEAADCRAKVAKLIELALPAVVKRTSPPGGRLENLVDYGRQATYLGQFNLALGCYRRIGGDGRYDRMHAAVSDALHRALEAKGGGPLESFPTLSWPFDTIPCLVSLRLYDLARGQDRSGEVIRRHLQWIDDHGTDPALGLPFSRPGTAAKPGGQAPRGCELSLRLCLLPHIDRDRARKLYRRYVRSFWRERLVVAGFAEWPEGRGGGADLDSGPILLDVGMAATGFGLGAALAQEDRGRVARLARQVAGFEAIRKAAAEQGSKGGVQAVIPFDARYVTGFLFGDACLFYAATWREWAVRE